MDSLPYKIPEGLSQEQVQDRIRRGLVNGSEDVKTKSFGEILLTNIVTPFNLLNVALAVCILLVGSPKNALFMGVIFSNTLIGTIQEIRSKRLIDKLALIAAPKAHVIRNGQSREIAVADIVMDDLMSIRAGQQVCADAVVLSGECEVNESLITGESDPVVKQAGDHVMSGSFLVSGSCLAVVEHVGADNYATKITQQAKYLKRTVSEIMQGINKIIKTVSAILLPVGGLLFCKQYYVSHLSLQDSVVSTVAALVGMIPEGLVLLTSVVMAVGIMRLGKRNALVQELYSIEMLARVDVLCLDKTGTITEGSMQVDEIRPWGNHTPEEIKLGLGVLVHGLEDENPTSQALQAFCVDEPYWKADEKMPFSSARKWSGVYFEGKGSYVMGAAEFVLQERAGEVKSVILEAASEGQRVLVLAKSREGFGIGKASDSSGTSYSQENRGHLPGDLEILGLVLLSDKIRNSAEQTLEYFADQGVTLKVISGDHPATVAHIARRAGLKGADQWVDATTLTDDDMIYEAASRYTVFGRVTPDQKLALVKALKAQGHTVAMTGDGANDVMALKESDCSIAMASGSDAARNVSQIVLLDSDFASMPAIVAEGRRSINNLQRSASLFLTKTFFSTIIGLLFIFVRRGYPLEPIQFTLISTLTIGTPSFFLALEPNKERVKGNFLINVIKKALPGALTNAITIVVLLCISNRFRLTPEELSTLAVLLVGFTGLLLLFKVCIPFTPMHVALFSAMTAGFTLAVLFLGDLFSLIPLTGRLLQLLLPLAGVAAGTLLLLLFLVEKVLGEPQKKA